MTDLYESHAARPFPELHGHGLRLRPWNAASEADVEAWLRGCTDPEFQRWNTPLRPVEGRDDARESLRARAKAAAEGGGASFCVTDEGSGARLGHLGVNDIDHVIRVARVGYRDSFAVHRPSGRW